MRSRRLRRCWTSVGQTPRTSHSSVRGKQESDQSSVPPRGVGTHAAGEGVFLGQGKEGEAFHPCDRGHSESGERSGSKA